MELLGDRNWYLPRWLEWLPHFEVGAARGSPTELATKRAMRAPISAPLSSCRKWPAPATISGPIAPGMWSAIRSAARGEKIGSESEKSTSAGFSQRPSASRTRSIGAVCRVLRLGRYLLGEGEDARLRLGYRPRCAVGLLDLVAHRLDARDANEPAGDQLGPDPAHEGAEAEPLLGRRPAAADAGVHDDEPRDPLRVLDGQPQADRAAPVLDDDRQVVQVELLDEPPDRAGVEVVGVVLAASGLSERPKPK